MEHRGIPNYNDLGHGPEVEGPFAFSESALLMSARVSMSFGVKDATTKYSIDRLEVHAVEVMNPMVSRLVREAT